MKITSVTISEDNSSINVLISDAADATTLTFWNNNTFKDYNRSINLSSKLTGSASENITITLSDINETQFDGVYFIEVEDPNEISLDYAYNIDKYKECIVDKILELNSCDECLNQENTDLINVSSLYKALEFSLELRYIDEILKFIKTLDKFCSNECKSCGSSRTVITDDNQSSGIVVTVDGGNI